MGYRRRQESTREDARGSMNASRERGTRSRGARSRSVAGTPRHNGKRRRARDNEAQGSPTRRDPDDARQRWIPFLAAAGAPTREPPALVLVRRRPIRVPRREASCPALNEGAFEAAIAMLSPVRGLRPWRAPRIFVVNVPNPGMATLSSLVSASLIAENTASTTADASALESAASVATWDERSDFFIRGSLGECAGPRRRPRW